MTQPAPLKANGHLGTSFASLITAGLAGQTSRSQHPQGRHRPGDYAPGHSGGAFVRCWAETYTVPDGSNPSYPVPQAFEPIYLWRAKPGDAFIGGWWEGTQFSGQGKLKAIYQDEQGQEQTKSFGGETALLGANTDAFFLEPEALLWLADTPGGQGFDLVFEPHGALTPGDRFSVVLLYTNA